MSKIPHRLYLTEDQMPRQWFNLRSAMPEQPDPLIHPGTLFQKGRSGFLVGVIIPLKTAGKAKMVFFIHTVEQSVVGAGGKGQQLRSHIPVRVVSGVEVFQ